MQLKSTFSANGYMVQSQFSKSNEWFVKLGPDIILTSAQPFPSVATGGILSVLKAPRDLIQEVLLYF